MEGKFQEIMHMPYNLIFRMLITNGGMIKEYQVFKDHGKAVYEKSKVINAPKEYKKLEYTLCWGQTLWEFQDKTCDKWTYHQRTQ